MIGRRSDMSILNGLSGRAMLLRCTPGNFIVSSGNKITVSTFVYQHGKISNLFQVKYRNLNIHTL